MVRCEYCNNVYYNNETNCTSCGAVLPRVEPRVKPENEVNNEQPINNQTNFNQVRQANRDDDDKVLVVTAIISIIVIILIVVFTVKFIGSLFEKENPTVTNIEKDHNLTISEDKFKYGEKDLSRFEKFYEIYTNDPTDKESLVYLSWYYLYNKEPLKAFEVVDNFLEIQVKDDSSVYIELSEVYLHYKLYGYAYYILDSGYNLTKLESIREYNDSVSVDNIYKNTKMGDMLSMIFGKNLSLITYQDLKEIKAIVVDEDTKTIFYSTTTPVFVDGYIENYEDYKSSMEQITLSDGVSDGLNLEIFVELEVLIDDSSRGVFFDELQYSNNLRYLELYGYGTIEKLPVLPKLEGLCVKGSSFVAIGNIEKFDNLLYLRLYYTEVHDISKIVKLENIKALSIENNDNITDLDSVTQIPTLKCLEVIDTEIISLNLNADIVSLEKLVINRTDIRNVAFLANCSQLKELTIVNNYDILSIPNLSNLTLLESLTVQSIASESYYSDVEFIRGLNSLKKLYINGNLHKIGALTTMTGLEELEINASIIADDISGLSALTNLKKLTIKGSPMSSIINVSFLSSMKGLTYLDFSNAKYIRGNAIFNLEHLEVLYLDTFAGDFRNISNLKNLKELYINNVSIMEDVYVESYGGMSTIYYVRSKELTDFTSQLSQLTNLEALAIGDNKIEDISFISNLSNLQKLSLVNNYITDLAPLDSLNNLTYLDVTKNPITNWGTLSGKKDLTIVENK